MQPSAADTAKFRRRAAIAVMAFLVVGVFVLAVNFDRAMHVLSGFGRTVLNAALNDRPPMTLRGYVVAESTFAPLSDARVRVDASTTGVTWENKWGAWMPAVATYKTETDSNGWFEVTIKDHHTTAYMWAGAPARAMARGKNPSPDEPIIAVLARLPERFVGRDVSLRVDPLSASTPGGWNFELEKAVASRDSADVWFSWNAAATKLQVFAGDGGGVLFVGTEDLGGALDPEAAICQAPRSGYREHIQLSESTTHGVVIARLADRRAVKLVWAGPHYFQHIRDRGMVQLSYTYNSTSSGGLCRESALLEFDSD